MAKNIVMIGSGYVGLVTGACLADIGHKVTCVDKDKSKIKILENGQVPIFEPGLANVIARNVKAKRLKFSNTLSLDKADAVFLAVGTPTDSKTGNADMSAFFAAAREVKSKLKAKTVVVTKSTVPVGTGDKLKEIFKNKADIVSNPEFLREGSAVADFMQPDRIVIGVDDSKNAKQLMEKIYSPVKSPLMVTSVKSAELIKYAANAFLATKVTFINEVADLCEQLGADVEEVSRGMGFDKRIGDKFLKAGPGMGGSCFPKDVRALAAQGENVGLDIRIIDSIIKSNEVHKRRMAQKIAAIVKSGTIAVFGLTFKANTDDMRESPALTIIPELQKRGFKIRAYDPQGLDEAKKLLKNIEFCTSAQEAATGANAIVVITEWAEFKKIKFANLKLKKKIIIDLRNLLDKSTLHGFDYYSVGRQLVSAKNSK